MPPVVKCCRLSGGRQEISRVERALVICTGKMEACEEVIFSEDSWSVGKNHQASDFIGEGLDFTAIILGNCVDHNP